MLTHINPSIFFLAILTLLLQGCGSSDSSATYPTTLAEGVSVGTTDENAVMAPNALTLSKIADTVGSLVKSDVLTLNQKEATSFTKETNYCDISGLKESETSGTLNKITTITDYQNCKTAKNDQNGSIKINYEEMNAEGKCPKKLYLLVHDTYTFNNLELGKDLTIDSNITYNTDESIKAIEVKINGTLTFEKQGYVLQNIIQTITY